MAGNYDSRKVARDEFPWGFISTAYVNDGSKPYETAVEHPDYNAGSMVIVESYDTKVEAKRGHKKWVKRMTGKPLPVILFDCCNAGVAQLCAALGMNFEHKRKKKRASKKTA